MTRELSVSEVKVMSGETVRILDGNTFAVSDAKGDIEASPTVPSGFFAFDTRYLSEWKLRINGKPLQALSVDDIQYHEARFFLVPESSHYVDAKISVIRHRWIGCGLNERISVISHVGEPADLTVRVGVACDFSDLFEIKDVRKKVGTRYIRVEGEQLRLGYQREEFKRETLISASEPVEVDERGLTFKLWLAPHGSWSVDLHVATLGPDGEDIRVSLLGHSRPIRTPKQDELDEWLADAPSLICDDDALRHAYQRSLVDLAALRISPLAVKDSVPAAGLPWFMALFGRDSIIASLQTLPFTPALASATLRLLAGMQGSRIDDFRDEEPGKIIHEWRYGESAAFQEQPHTPYYGASDATPLFVVLLDEYERWTGDGALVRALEPEARAAINWIDTYGDHLGNGYVWYQTRSSHGLENQCWKDSPNSIMYSDGSLPAFPRATCEVQGYVYDAKRRAARLARLYWNDATYADQLERDARELRKRFNRDFWVDEGEYFAIALDPHGERLEVLSSNIGHLLWSGIVEPERGRALARHLLGPRLFSGWGVRTLAKGEARYNPVGYHVGAVWPFDNSLIAWGLWRYGFREEAGTIAEAMIRASEYFGGRLPEAFAGYDRELTRYPVEYPTACSPQAWSTGAPLLLVRTMLGMQPRGNELHLDPAVRGALGRVSLSGVPGRWGRAEAKN